MGSDLIDGRHMPDLAEYTVNVGTAVAYSFRFAEPFGWAIFTVNDCTGEFQIQSDWGQWQFRWAISALGESAKKSGKPLTHFLAVRSDPSYVVVKFGYNQPSTFSKEFSLNKTVIAMKERIIECRKEGGAYNDDHAAELKYCLSRKQARDCWDQLKIWEETHPGDSEAALMMSVNAMQECQPDLYALLTGREKVAYGEWGYMIDQDVWEHFEYEGSWEYVFLKKRLLPFFFDYLRREVLHIDDKGKAA